MQDYLNEYKTRLSAWKKTRHVKTGELMESMWVSYNANKQVSTQEKQQTFVISELQEKLAQAKEEIVTLTNKEKENETEHRVEPILLNSPYGAYLVLQHLGESNPKEAEQLKKKGLLTFRNMIRDFAKTDSGVLEAPESHEWYTKLCGKSSKKSEQEIARSVYDFFH